MKITIQHKPTGMQIASLDWRDGDVIEQYPVNSDEIISIPQTTIKTAVRLARSSGMWQSSFDTIHPIAREIRFSDPRGFMMDLENTLTNLCQADIITSSPISPMPSVEELHPPLEF